MDHEQNPYDEQPSTPPSPGRQPWRASRAAVGVGLAAFLGLAGAGAAFAFTGSGNTSSSASGSTSTTTPSSLPPKGLHFPHGYGFGPMMGGFGGSVVHGQYTVKTSSGYQTVLEQVGAVVNVSSTSIEVKSTDGYDHTYSVASTTIVDSQANGIATVAKNDEVRLEAVQQSGKDVATNITDTTKIGSSRKGFGFGPIQPPQPPQSPQSSSSSSAGQANVAA